jgi:hypothetical protein
LSALRALSAQANLSGEAPFWRPEKFLTAILSALGDDGGGKWGEITLPAFHHHGRTRVAHTPDQLVDLAFRRSIAPTVTDAGPSYSA